MNKKRAKILIKEFEKAHYNYSVSNLGHWKKDWKATLKYAQLKKGCWYWKGYSVSDLYNLLVRKEKLFKYKKENDPCSREVFNDILKSMGNKKGTVRKFKKRKLKYIKLPSINKIKRKKYGIKLQQTTIRRMA